MILKNAEVFNEKFDLVHSDLSVCGGKIEKLAPCLAGDETLDLTGCRVAPGFVDIHIHGCAGADTGDATRQALETMSARLLHKGVTSFCPTTMSVPLAQIERELANIRDCMQQPLQGAAVCGANMEGPYISPERRGAQKLENVRVPDWQEFERLYRGCGGIVKLVDMAPECAGGGAFIEHVSPFCKVSLAHSMADYAQTAEAFSRGVTHVTHLFNAMEGLHHRCPGAVGAVFDSSSVSAELICDGFHIHPAVLRLAFRLLGEDRTIIISDSMRAAGMPDGLSELGGQPVYVREHRAYLKDGTIAGSTTDMLQEVKNLIAFGVPVKQVIKSATINPAREIGQAGRIGSIAPGRRADLTVFDKDWNLRFVMQGGRLFQLKN
ncbi:MAG: N-acetylglucosamine-6-phosphate deacetylase [Oscillospiraceae bacterium]|jgi:N-acetylglucosamine-6-phosphate deacetylase|nr:N-acetylglucosamine-6-phosphate deacetylase [Oscillospiraceae bacterium]